MANRQQQQMMGAANTYNFASRRAADDDCCPPPCCCPPPPCCCPPPPCCCPPPKCCCDAPASQQQQVLRVFDDDGSFTGHQALAVYEQQQRQMQRARALMQQQQYGNQRMDDCCPPPPCCCPPPPCCCPPPPCCCDDVGDAPDVLDMFEQRVDEYSKTFVTPKKIEIAEAEEAAMQARHVGLSDQQEQRQAKRPRLMDHVNQAGARFQQGRHFANAYRRFQH